MAQDDQNEREPKLSTTSAGALSPISERQSAAFYVFKGLAIFSVVCAHAVAVKNLNGAAEYALHFRDVFKTLGVPCFFFAAGYFYKRSSGDSLKFWTKKFKTVILPWLFGAAITFLFYALKDREFADMPIRFVKWFLGLGSWFYFTSVLILCFAWFKVVTGRFNIWLTIALTAAAMTMTRVGAFPYCEWFTAYVNPFNWLGWFGLGLLARRRATLQLFEKKRPILTILGLAALALGVGARFYFDDWTTVADVGTNTKILPGYFCTFAIPIEFGGLVAMLALSSVLAKSAFLAELGKKSFAIFLYHMPIVGVANRLIPQRSVATMFLSPLAALLATYAILRVVEFGLAALGKIDFGGKKLPVDRILTYLGIR